MKKYYGEGRRIVTGMERVRDWERER